MEFYIGLFQTFGIHTLLGMSAYFLLLTGQISMAQAAFFGLGAFTAGILTTVYGWHVVPALIGGGVFSGVIAFFVGFPALRVRGMMLFIVTLVLSQLMRLFLGALLASLGGMQIGGIGFRQIRFFPENGWTTLQVSLFVWVIVILLGGVLWWMDRSRMGAVFRAVGQDEAAAQSVGINLTTVKVAAMTIGGIVAGVGGGVYAHAVTHVNLSLFSVLLATFAIAYPILGGLHSVFGSLFAVVFIQGFLVEFLRPLGDWRNLLFGLLIVLAMNLRLKSLRDPQLAAKFRRFLGMRARTGSDLNRPAESG